MRDNQFFKLPLTMAIASCLLVACSNASKTQLPKFKPAPAAPIVKNSLPASDSLITPPPVVKPAPVAVVAPPLPAASAAPAPISSPVRIAPASKPDSASVLDQETLEILDGLLEARDMSMVEGDKLLVDRDGDVWDRIRRGYSINQPAYNARIEAQKSWFASRQDYLNRLTARASRYLYYTVTEAERRGIPTELALLPVIESSYDPAATSNAQAAGLWQFIPTTGLLFGLNQSLNYDGRRDIIESTRAAYDFLTLLYNQFGSWELALAAYNAGPGRIQKAIDSNANAGLPTDYWSLRLPSETMNYVPRFMAVAQIVFKPDAYNVSFPRIANRPHFRTVPVNEGVSLQEVAATTGVSLDELQLLNPALTNLHIDRIGPNRVVIPNSIAENVDAQLSALMGFGFRTPPKETASYIAPMQTKVVANTQSEMVLRQTNTLPTTKAAITASDTIIQEPPLSLEERNYISQELRKQGNVSPLGSDGNFAAQALQTGQSTLEKEGRYKKLSYTKNAAPTKSAVPTNHTYPLRSPVPPASAKIPPEATSTYQVQPGDTLSKIAAKYGMSIAQLRHINQLGINSTLYAGKVLTVVGSPMTERSSARRSSKSERYTVQKGDTLSQIALQHGLSAAQLAEYNHLTASAKVITGQRLWLVAGKVKSAAAPQPKTSTYQVQPGDTLIGVAQRLGISPEEIAALNPFGDHAKLIAGHRIVVPAQAAGDKKTASKSERIIAEKYTVQAGDTLIGVAAKHKMSVADLAAINHLKENAKLVRGSTLMIAQVATPKPKQQASSKNTIKDSESYQVQAGDTLTKLADRYGVAIADLAQLNHLPNSARLFKGQSIKVPKLTTTYTVKAGDTLIGVAKQFAIETAELAKMNDLKSTDGLKRGQKLTVPKR